MQFRVFWDVAPCSQVDVNINIPEDFKLQCCNCSRNIEICISNTYLQMDYITLGGFKGNIEEKNVDLKFCVYRNNFVLLCSPVSDGCSPKKTEVSRNCRLCIES
jgi:hypothetical protein